MIYRHLQSHLAAASGGAWDAHRSDARWLVLCDCRIYPAWCMAASVRERVQLGSGRTSAYRFLIPSQLGATT